MFEAQCHQNRTQKLTAVAQVARQRPLLPTSPSPCRAVNPLQPVWAWHIGPWSVRAKVLQDKAGSGLGKQAAQQEARTAAAGLLPLPPPPLHATCCCLVPDDCVPNWNHSLKWMAPVDRTKKKVEIMRPMMVVKDSTMTTWVSVILVHQGVESCERNERREGSRRGSKRVEFCEG